MTTSEPTLADLATLCGLQAEYEDMEGNPRRSPPESVFRVLQLLGVDVTSEEDVPAAWEARRSQAWSRPLEPVLVAWDGGPAAFEVRYPLDVEPSSVTLDLRLEDGSRRRWDVDLAATDRIPMESLDRAFHRIALPQSLPPGYHRLTATLGDRQAEALVLSAPLRAYRPPARPRSRPWGVFLPLYALRTARSWGAGDFTDLTALMDWVGARGGQLVGILPILAAFLGGDSHEPSPYAPASRLFWNEFYVDVTRIPELADCPEAQDLLASPAFQGEVAALRAADRVDYRGVMALKRSVLERLARHFFTTKPPRFAAFRRFREDRPEVEAYARFRAVAEGQGRPWPAWPEPLRSGDLTDADYDEGAFRYHLYAQWVAQEQVASLTTGPPEAARAVYLDLPLGVHSHGYDAWRWRDAFVPEVSVGAPPDVFFTEGQDWGFPPLHPQRIRELGYPYLAATLRHHTAHADVLRVDHVMGLHRLWWIPRGMPAREGVYVRYHADELYALLTLESHRGRCAVVGENLGTVPSYVNEAMDRHGLLGMYVVQYEARPRRPPLPDVPRETLASLNTHDMPPFAAFWDGWDVDLRVDLGLLDARGARRERRRRERLKEALVTFLRKEGVLEDDDPGAVMRASYAHLAASAAAVVMVNLEDLWLEERPQNVPGTVDPANWARKARYALEAVRERPEVAEALARIDALRRGS